MCSVGGQRHTICAQVISQLNIRGFRGPGGPSASIVICEYLGTCCVTVKMDAEQTNTMSHYCLCSACGSKYNLALVGHQLIIRDLPELKTVVSSSVAEVVRTKVKQTIGMKLATDREGDSSESKSGNEDT